MKTLGLTGGVGMGKSTAANILAKLGVPVIDTDLIAREIVEPGQPALKEIRAQFGSDLIDVEGRLRRQALARRVFADPEARKTLEAILHPRIREIWQGQAAQWRAEGVPVGLVVIPLLFETGAEVHFDATLCVACTPATQRERLTARGWTNEEMSERIRAQWPVERKIGAATYVIWSEGTVAALEEQLRLVLSGEAQPAPA